MALREVTTTWTAPEITTARKLVMLNDGALGYVALGTAVPSDGTDGVKIRSEGFLILEAGTTYRLRSARGTVVFYEGDLP